jgi:hypothetical protein
MGGWKLLIMTIDKGERSAYVTVGVLTAIEHKVPVEYEAR